MYLSFLAIGIIIFETYIEFKKGRTALSIIEQGSLYRRTVDSLLMDL